MEKKLVIEILEKLKPHWELAEWMIALIEAWFMDKDTYKNTLFMISAEIKRLSEWDEKTELQAKLMILKDKLKAEEATDYDGETE